MNRYSPRGWRRFPPETIKRDRYLALSDETGRGIVKRLQDQWVFVSRREGKDFIFPTEFLSEIFYLDELEVS